MDETFRHPGQFKRACRRRVSELHKNCGRQRVVRCFLERIREKCVKYASVLKLEEMIVFVPGVHWLHALLREENKHKHRETVNKGKGLDKQHKGLSLEEQERLWENSQVRVKQHWNVDFVSFVKSVLHSPHQHGYSRLQLKYQNLSIFLVQHELQIRPEFYIKGILPTVSLLLESEATSEWALLTIITLFSGREFHINDEINVLRVW